MMGGGLGETLMAVRGSGGGLPTVCGPLLWATQYAHDFYASCDNAATLLLSQLRLPPLGRTTFQRNHSSGPGFCGQACRSAEVAELLRQKEDEAASAL